MPIPTRSLSLREPLQLGHKKVSQCCHYLLEQLLRLSLGRAAGKLLVLFPRALSLCVHSLSSRNQSVRNFFFPWFLSLTLVMFIFLHVELQPSYW